MIGGLGLQERFGIPSQGAWKLCESTDNRTKRLTFKCRIGNLLQGSS
jgi:hypothetical protein